MAGGNLILVLGDQLDRRLLREAAPGRDTLAMAEVAAEVQRFPNHRQRVALFLAAMRHFRDEARAAGFEVDYQEIGDAPAAASLAEFLGQRLRARRPHRAVLVEPGRWDLEQELQQVAAAAGVEAELRPDPHFLCTRQEFADWAAGRKVLVLEHFYRYMRRRTGHLMDGDQPEAGRWNLDAENRGHFGRGGPGRVPAPRAFPPDAVTNQVLAAVAGIDGLYGSAARFGWPVTPGDATAAVDDFVEHRLPLFGQYQDAMWTGEPYLYHSRLAAALNLKLIDPTYAIEAATDAYLMGHAPLNAVEGLVRQILGWREFIRGVYWLHMPEYMERNELAAEADLPGLYWTGETRMRCLREVVEQLLVHGQAHHIQRLMVAGLFALLYGAAPRQVHDWFMALYCDSVEWVTLPNVLGMSQFADGGVVGTKPYAATGRYIQRMSNYCTDCPYDPAQATGPDACPFTTLYWDFLARHRQRFAANRRMVFQVRNLERKAAGEGQEIRRQAEVVRLRVRAGDI